MITPQKEYPELADAVGVASLWLKREDLHPYESHKGRSIPVMVEAYAKKGARDFAITGSGNAALAAILYLKEWNKGNAEKLSLEILVGNNIAPNKLKKLKDAADVSVSINHFERPLMALAQKTADGSVISLRQSTDDTALLGYGSLAEELAEIKDLKAVFMGTSSGTTMQALAAYFQKNKKGVEIHIVQTTSCHPLADGFVDSVPSDDDSLADAIVDQAARRKDALVPLIEKSGGSGWIVENQELTTAQELILKHAGIKVSANGALGMAGLMQAALSGKEWDGAVVCIVGGE